MKIIEGPYDEFNYYPCVNFYATELKEDFAVVTFKGYECLYPNFKKIITIDTPDNITNLSPNERQNMINEKISSTGLEIIKYSDCIQNIHPNTHIYQYLFSNYTQHIINNKTALFSSPQEDVDFVKNRLKDVKKPIVCINGRNLNKLSFRNNLFEELITPLIRSGLFIINCTINQPGFKFDEDSYLEPGSELISYNRNLAYFKESKLVISVCDSGAVSTHLMSDCNMILLGAGGWVDNPGFGYNGESMVSARMKYFNAKTIRVADSHSGLKIIKDIINEI